MIQFYDPSKTVEVIAYPNTRMQAKNDERNGYLRAL